MKRSVPFVLLAALVALVAWQGLRGSGRDAPIDRDEAGEPAAPLKVESPDATAPKTDDGATLAGDPDRKADTGEAARITPPDEAAFGTAAVADYDGEIPPGWHEAPPAQRPHAIRPPRPRGPSAKPGGSSGGVGPTGHWSRFPPPPPPKGDAAIHVVVTDQIDARVPGADVYLGPRENLGEEAVSFGDLRKIGTTNADGELLAPDLPAGAAVVAANVANLLNGPRGLDARTSIPVLLLSHATVRASVKLPLEAGGFGRVTGRVVDEKERPIAGAEVRSGFFRTYADAEGRFDAPHLPAGLQTVSARRSGYRAETVEVDVPKGGARDVEIALGWKESGELHLEGRVLTHEGAGLEGATLYLIDEGGRGTLRNVRTDIEGRYRFEALPDRLRTAPVRVQADKFREGYRATNVRLDAGIADTHLDITLRPRLVKVRFVLRDAGTGEAVDRCRIEGERLDDPAAGPRGFTGRREDGVYEHYYDAGRYRFSVEAPDRETQAIEADLAPPGGTVELTVRFPGRGSDAVRITLRVTVDDQVTGDPVPSCSIVVLDARGGDEVARFVGRAPDGIYSMPAPSGLRTLRVSAEGYETAEDVVELPADPPEANVTIHLRPR